MNNTFNHSLDAIIHASMREAKAIEQLHAAFDRAVVMVGASSVARSLIEDKVAV
jgi:hypothetical protein